MGMFVNIFFAVIIGGIAAYIGYEYYSQHQRRKNGKLVTKSQKETVENYLNVS